MSNRHERRTEIARFRREAAGTHLVTFLIPVGTPLGDHPILLGAVEFGIRDHDAEITANQGQAGVDADAGVQKHDGAPACLQGLLIGL